MPEALRVVQPEQHYRHRKARCLSTLDASHRSKCKSTRIHGNVRREADCRRTMCHSLVLRSLALIST